MSTPRITPYSVIHVTREQADGVRRLTMQLGAALGRRVTHDQTVQALLRIAQQDPEMLHDAITYVREQRANRSAD
jgi:lipopolysaccharide biosynthesis regulator YciM